MSNLISEATIKVRQDTAGNWTASNPTLSAGEWGYETDTGKAKIGDGSTAWNSLEYAAETGIVEQVATNTANLPDSTKQLCKAWVNFDGTTNVGGFCTIRDSYNVTSITDNGTGKYIINFTNAMSDANYSVSGLCGLVGLTAGLIIDTEATSKTVSTYKFATVKPSTEANTDMDNISIQVFGS